MAPDNDVLGFIKDFIWAPLLGLVAWAWQRNEKAHDMLWAKHDAIRKDASDGHSALNDRLMEHIDIQVNEVKDQQRRQSDKFAEHITKLFENAEADRRHSNEQFAAIQKEAFQRHLELLTAINSKANRDGH